MNTTPHRNLPEILKQLGGLLGQPHVADDYVRFRIQLLKAQTEVLTAIRPRPAPPSGAADTQQAPMLDAATVPMDSALLASLAESIRFSAGKDGHHSAVLDRLGEAAVYEPDLLKELACRAAFGPDQDYLESLASRLEVSTEALVFVGRALAAPFVTSQAEPIRTRYGRSFTTKRRESGHCPVCGSPPALARLEGDEGRRILCCSLCGQCWAFARLACPYCGNQDQQSLGKLTVADQEPRWIEVCDACRGYLKTVDTRRLPAGASPYTIVEETATLHLDLLAEKEGYLRRLPYVALT